MSIDFDRLTKDPRDVVAPPGSANAELLALPQQRKFTHDMKGKLLYFPRTDQVMVPFNMDGDGGWNVVVVHNGPRAPRREDPRYFAYTPGGYNLYVSALEMQTAIELEPSDEFAVMVTTPARREFEMPAADLDAARGIVQMNEQHANTSVIIQSISFEPEFPWEVPAT